MSGFANQPFEAEMCFQINHTWTQSTLAGLLMRLLLRWWLAAGLRLFQVQLLSFEGEEQVMVANACTHWC